METNNNKPMATSQAEKIQGAIRDYNVMMDYLCSSRESFCRLREYLDEHNFIGMPASANHHLNVAGGLVLHSVNVAHTLQDFTTHLGLTWQRKDSPIIVGLLHDLCKLDSYRYNAKDDKWYYNDKQEIDVGGHGIASVVLAQRFIQLTDEELYCIRYHMGAYEQKDWSKYDLAIRRYPNVLYTHTADMVASKLMED